MYIKLRKVFVHTSLNHPVQGSVLAPFLFNIYIYDLPITIARKFACTDDLAIPHATFHWKTLEETLNQDMAAIFLYLQK